MLWFAFGLMWIIKVCVEKMKCYVSYLMYRMQYYWQRDYWWQIMPIIRCFYGKNGSWFDDILWYVLYLYLYVMYIFFKFESLFLWCNEKFLKIYENLLILRPILATTESTRMWPVWLCVGCLHFVHKTGENQTFSVGKLNFSPISQSWHVIWHS